MVEPISTEQARRAGISRKQLRSKAWTHVRHGVYRARSDDPDADVFERRMRVLQPVLTREERFGHLCAAYLYGLWLPSRPPEMSLLVSVEPDSERPKRNGVYAFRSRAAEQSWRSVRGLPVVTPQVCIGQLAEDLSVLDL